MAKVTLRKYDYIFFDDGTKERIFKWFYVPNDWYFLKDFILITKDHTYWYTERRTCDESEIQSDKDCLYKQMWVAKRNHLYRLKSGIHNLDISNYKQWDAVENFDRFEIMIENEKV